MDAPGSDPGTTTAGNPVAYLLCSRPIFSARYSASAAACACMQTSAWFTSLAAMPLPTGPKCITCGVRER